MTRPNENSSVEKIKSYEPNGIFANWKWFHEKQELIRKKNSFWYKFKPSQFMSSYYWHGGRREQLIRYKTSLRYRIVERIKSLFSF